MGLIVNGTPNIGNFSNSSILNNSRPEQPHVVIDIRELSEEIFKRQYGKDRIDITVANLEFLEKIRIAMQKEESLKPLIESFEIVPENPPQPSYSLLKIAVQNFSEEGIKLFCDLKCVYLCNVVSIIFTTLENDVKYKNTTALARYQLFIIRILKQNPEIRPQAFCRHYLNSLYWKRSDIDVHIFPILESISDNFEINTSALIADMDFEELRDLEESGKLNWLSIDEDIVMKRIAELTPKAGCTIQ